jgi:dihydrodipicolinate synthase/N-acetylneuraminate lyase
LKQLKGIFPALVSPYTSEGEFDKRAFGWLCNNCIDHGAHGLILAGSLGEFPNLRPEEWEAEVAIAVDHANGKVPVLVGASSASTDASIRLAKKAKDGGADAAMILPPFYYQVSDEAVYRHYSAVTHAVDLPVVIYNFPATTKVNLTPQFIARLAGMDGIIGIKNSFDSLVHLREIIRLTRNAKGFSVIAGMEDYLIPGLLLGAGGSVSGLSNFVPQVMVKIYEAFMRGDVGEASDMFNRIVVPLKALAPPPEPISALKIGASLIGPVGTKVRLPLLDAPEGTREAMKEFLGKMDLLPRAAAKQPVVRIRKTN